jgi:hypothetical protein
MSNSMFVATNYNSKEEWVAAHVGMLSATDAARMLCGNRNYLRDIKMGKCFAADISGEARVLRGIREESKIAALVADAYSGTLENLGSTTLCVSKRYHRFCCTPDRLMNASDQDGCGLVEIKTTDLEHAHNYSYTAKGSSWVQMQWQMMVMDLKWGVIGVGIYDGDKLVDFKHFYYKRDDVFLNRAINTAYELLSEIDEESDDVPF